VSRASTTIDSSVEDCAALVMAVMCRDHVKEHVEGGGFERELRKENPIVVCSMPFTTSKFPDFGRESLQPAWSGIDKIPIPSSCQRSPAEQPWCARGREGRRDKNSASNIVIVYLRFTAEHSLSLLNPPTSAPAAPTFTITLQDYVNNPLQNSHSRRINRHNSNQHAPQSQSSSLSDRYPPPGHDCRPVQSDQPAVRHGPHLEQVI